MDDGHRLRHGSRCDHYRRCGPSSRCCQRVEDGRVQEAKLKQQIIKATASYLLKRGDEKAALRSEVEIADAVHAHQGVLDLAINIAETSAQNLVNPVLRTPIAGAAAYLMLTATPPWPEQRVREKIALFQTGQSSAGESEPTFIAGQIIEKARTKTEAKDRLANRHSLLFVRRSARKAWWRSAGSCSPRASM